MHHKFKKRSYFSCLSDTQFSTFVASAWSFSIFIPATTANDLWLQRISIPDVTHYIFYPVFILQKEPVFLFLMLSAKQGTTGTIFITSLLWRGPWLGIEPPTLEASILSLGYRGGFQKHTLYILTYIDANQAMSSFSYISTLLTEKSPAVFHTTWVQRQSSGFIDLYPFTLHTVLLTWAHRWLKVVSSTLPHVLGNTRFLPSMCNVLERMTGIDKHV